MNFLPFFLLIQCIFRNSIHSTLNGNTLTVDAVASPALSSFDEWNWMDNLKPLCINTQVSCWCNTSVTHTWPKSKLFACFGVKCDIIFFHLVFRCLLNSLVIFTCIFRFENPLGWLGWLHLRGVALSCSDLIDHSVLPADWAAALTKKAQVQEIWRFFFFGEFPSQFWQTRRVTHHVESNTAVINAKYTSVVLLHGRRSL